MQEAGKSAMASAKETAANIGASAKSGMEKTKAVVQEKVDKATAHKLVDKDTAEQRKLEKLEQAEANKQAAMARNATDRVRASKGPASGHPASALPGQPGEGVVVEGVVKSHPIGMATGTNRTSTAHNPMAGSAKPGSHGTGGAYNQRE